MARDAELDLQDDFTVERRELESSSFDLAAFSGNRSSFLAGVNSAAQVVNTASLVTTDGLGIVRDQAVTAKANSLSMGDVILATADDPQEWDEINQINFFKVVGKSRVVWIRHSNLRSRSQKAQFEGTFELGKDVLVAKLTEGSLKRQLVEASDVGRKSDASTKTAYDLYTGKQIEYFDKATIGTHLPRTLAVRRLSTNSVIERLLGPDLKLSSESGWRQLVVLGKAFVKNNAYAVADHVKLYVHFTDAQFSGADYFKALENRDWGQSFSLSSLSQVLPEHHPTDKIRLAENLLTLERFLTLCHGEHFVGCMTDICQRLINGTLFRQEWAGPYLQYVFEDQLEVFFREVGNSTLDAFVDAHAPFSLATPESCVLWLKHLLGACEPTQADQQHFFPLTPKYQLGIRWEQKFVLPRKTRSWLQR